MCVCRGLRGGTQLNTTINDHASYSFQNQRARPATIKTEATHVRRNIDMLKKKVHHHPHIWVFVYKSIFGQIPKQTHVAMLHKIVFGYHWKWSRITFEPLNMVKPQCTIYIFIATKIKGSADHGRDWWRTNPKCLCSRIFILVLNDTNKKNRWFIRCMPHNRLPTMYRQTNSAYFSSICAHI